MQVAPSCCGLSHAAVKPRPATLPGRGPSQALHPHASSVTWEPILSLSPLPLSPALSPLSHRDYSPTVPLPSTLSPSGMPSTTFSGTSWTPLRHSASPPCPSVQRAVLRCSTATNCWARHRVSPSLSVLVCKRPQRASHFMRLLGRVPTARGVHPTWPYGDSPVRKRLKRHLPPAPRNPPPR